MRKRFYGLAREERSVTISQAMMQGVKTKKLMRMFALFMATSLLLASGSINAYAATIAPNTPATNGYRLSPVRTDLTIDPGSSSIVTVYIQNASSAVENLQVVVDDFEAPTNESGNPALLLNGATAPQHSLKQFTTAPTTVYTLQPNQQATVNVRIAVPAGAPSGGYYGAIRFAPVGAGGNKNVNLSASIASLVLLTVPGNLVEQLSIAGFGVAQSGSTKTHEFFLSNKNLQTLVRFQNSGNIQEQPFGKVLLERGSTSLGSYSVNGTTPPGNVLPDSIRLFSVNLSEIGWYGKYKVEGNFGYGSKGQLLTAQSIFYVVPILLIILIILVVLLILFIIFGLPRFIRSYNRRVIARANRRR